MSGIVPYRARVDRATRIADIHPAWQRYRLGGFGGTEVYGTITGTKQGVVVDNNGVMNDKAGGLMQTGTYGTMLTASRLAATSDTLSAQGSPTKIWLPRTLRGFSIASFALMFPTMAQGFLDSYGHEIITAQLNCTLKAVTGAGVSRTIGTLNTSQITGQGGASISASGFTYGLISGHTPLATVADVLLTERLLLEVQPFISATKPASASAATLNLTVYERLARDQGTTGGHNNYGPYGVGQNTWNMGMDGWHATLALEIV